MIIKVKTKALLLISLCLINFSIKSQIVKSTYVKNGNIFIQYDNGNYNQITYQSFDTLPSLSKNNNFVIYLRTIRDSSMSEEGNKETKIMRYNIANSTESVLVQGCKRDGSGSSGFSYANSNDYPFSDLCNIYNLQLSYDGQRIYFQTEAWVVSSAIHYYDIPSDKQFFFHAGDLKKVLPDGNLLISITGIEQGKGRYWQDWVYDKIGRPIRSNGKKEY